MMEDFLFDSNGTLLKIGDIVSYDEDTNILIKLENGEIK